MNTVAAIMTEPDFAEVCFLIAVIVFVLEVIVCIARPANWAYSGLLLAVGLAAISLGFLAL